MPATGWTTSSSRSSDVGALARTFAAAPAVPESASSPALTAVAVVVAAWLLAARALLVSALVAPASVRARRFWSSCWPPGGCRLPVRCGRRPRAPARRTGDRIPLPGRRCVARGVAPRSGESFVPLGGRALRSAVVLGGRRMCRCPQSTGLAAAGAPLACPLTFLDRGDQFVLTHTRRPLDAGLIGQRAQFGQHHGGQGAARPRRRSWRRECLWSRHSTAALLSVLSPAVNEVRISHGFPFFPR